MRTLPILFLLALFACSAPVDPPTERTSSTSQAIDAVPVGEVPISQFYKLPTLTPAVMPALPHSVVNIAYLQHKPGIIWGLLTGYSTQPLYKPCGPAFQAYQDMCVEDYQLTVAECDAYENTDADTCQAGILACQSGYCAQNYNLCVEEIPPCVSTDCLDSDEVAVQSCDAEEEICSQNISPGSICAHSFEVCLNTVMTQDSGCRDNAASVFETCSNNVGTCI
jgi:hypothetical protein